MRLSPRIVAAMVQSINTTAIAAIGAASAVVLIVLITLSVLFWRERVQHRRLIAQLETQGAATPKKTRRLNKQAKRPRNVLRRSPIKVLGGSQAWESLQSQDDVSAAPEDVKNKSWVYDDGVAVNFSGTMTGGIQSSTEVYVLNDLRKSALPGQPTGNTQLSSQAVKGINRAQSEEQQFKAQMQDLQDSDARFRKTIRPGSAELLSSQSTEDLQPEPLFSTSFASTQIPPIKTRTRANTIAPTIRPVAPSATFDQAEDARATRHVRSRSLGSRTSGLVPDAPVPPLPMTVSKTDIRSSHCDLNDRSVSRQSETSIESIGSSLLATSPRLQRPHSALERDKLKPDWSNSMIAGPRAQSAGLNIRQQLSSLPTVQGHLSIRSDAARFSDGLSIAAQARPLSDASHSRLAQDVDVTVSMDDLKTAEHVSLKRVSKLSFHDLGTPRDFQTPRKASRFIVLGNGSPAERERTTALRDITGNHTGLHRQPSVTSTSRASSTRSSNGNPFQWDPSPMAFSRPSAMKGSPTARKGHKRKNCVRISLPAKAAQPYIKSPASSMAGIQEESIEGAPTDSDDDKVSTSHSQTTHSRPPSSLTFAPELKVQPNRLQASLTAGSPSLSLNEFIPPREFSTLSAASSPANLLRRSGSNASSLLTIPSFPSPCKNSSKASLPAPTFSFTRPSNEYDHDEFMDAPEEFKLLARPYQDFTDASCGAINIKRSASPLATMMGLYVPSPPRASPGSGHRETINLAVLTSSASPALDHEDCDIASASLFAPLQSSPPSSPPTPRPSLPTLAEEPEIFVLDADTGTPKQYLVEVPEDAGLQDSGEQPGFKRKATLHGPRSPPASPLRASIARLRRMNSDAKESSKSSAARRYFKLGREASLPCYDVDNMLASSEVFSSTYHPDDSWVSIGSVLNEEGAGPAVERPEKESWQLRPLSMQEGLSAIHDSANAVEPILICNSMPARSSEETSRPLPPIATIESEVRLRQDSDTLPSLPSDSDLGTLACNEGHSNNMIHPQLRGEVDEVGDGKLRQSPATVWEDGENFWNAFTRDIQDENADPRVVGASTAGAAADAKIFEKRGTAVLEHYRVQTLRVGVDRNPGVSGGATPTGMGKSDLPVFCGGPQGSPGGVSLYDRDGFLKS